MFTSYFKTVLQWFTPYTLVLLTVVSGILAFVFARPFMERVADFHNPFLVAMVFASLAALVARSAWLKTLYSQADQRRVNELLAI